MEVILAVQALETKGRVGVRVQWRCPQSPLSSQLASAGGHPGLLKFTRARKLVTHLSLIMYGELGSCVFNSRRKEHFHELQGRRDVSESELSLVLSLWSRILYSLAQNDLLNYPLLFDEKNGGWQLSTYVVCLKDLFSF